MYISGDVRDEVLERIKNHPARGNRTQAEFYEYIFERFIDLPESRLANLEQSFRSLQLQVDFLKKRVEKTETLDKVVQALEAQVQQIASSEAEATDEQHGGAPEPPAPVSVAANGAQELEGDFAAVLDKGDTFETPSRSFVDLTLRVLGGTAEGRSFSDRVTDFPWAPRTDFCKRAFGLQPTDSLGKKLPEITGRKVQVRRTKKLGPDGSPRMITYYHPLPSGTSK